MDNPPSINPLKIGLKALEITEARKNKWEHTFNEMFETQMIYSSYTKDLERALIKILQLIYHDTDIIERWIVEYNFGRGTYSCSEQKIVNDFPLKTVEEMYEYFIQASFEEHDF